MEVYILKNCDTCKKALKWLQENSVASNIIDIRGAGIDEKTISDAVTGLGWEKVLNRRSTSWRNLSDEQKTDIDAKKAIALIVQNPTLMKRPLVISQDTFVVGFDKAAVQAIEKLIT